ncbi:MAG: subclass B1 metallo-beta-lactamase [Pseudomonadota bacterium]
MKFCTALIPFCFVFLFPQWGETREAKTILPNQLSVEKIQDRVFLFTDREFYSSNTLVVKMLDQSVVIVSSPFDDIGTLTMMNWIQENLKPKKIIAINTHFHRDGMGGNTIYKRFGAETWASDKSQELRRKANRIPAHKSVSFYKNPEHKKRLLKSPVETAEFTFSLVAGKEFNLSGEKVFVQYPGHAHSSDNTVVYFPSSKILFGGCMIKPKSLGYLGDANVENWPQAAAYLKKFDTRIVIPGHAPWGGPQLIDQTIKVAQKALLKKAKRRLQ